MKKILLITTILFTALSCTKSVLRDPGSEQVTKGITSVTEKRFLAEGEDSVNVKISADPTLICQGYGDRETPQSCNIYIIFKCTLSKPVERRVLIELERTNQPQQEKRLETEPGNNAESKNMLDPGAHIFLNLAPNTTEASFSSTLSNINNQAVPDNEFRIVSVTSYTQRD